MKHTFRAFLITLSMCMLLPGTLFALSLDEAKATGLVGEKGDGYLGIVSASSPEIQALVSDVNGKRKERYLEIAKKNGTDPRSVEQIAGKKAIENTPSGQFIVGQQGWTKK